jgi:peptidoglycan/LPS O-acetylase OafA/YrhL
MITTLEIEPPKRVAHPRKETYRPEIDGLRAIAVLVVVLFHARIGFFPGGFVGVDVFFVISGFLISGLILRDIHGAGFGFIDFMERRVRRIMPAMVVTVAAIVVAAWYLYLPQDFERLGRALKSQTLFTSNLFHRRLTGYFGPQAEAQPLLHTWSLAVEEQFYMVFPIMLVAVGFYRRQWLGPVIVALGVASFGLALWSVPRHQSDAFYFLPHRAWELLLGAFLAAYPAWGKTAGLWVREVVSWGGLFAIFLAVFIFDAETPFPGAAALLPCAGAAAFIWANRETRTTTGQFLSWEPFVFVGRISYSFYLIHWPLFVFAAYWFGTELPGWSRAGLVAVAFILSALSWLVVETPVRKRRVLATRRSLFLAGAASMVIFLATAELVRRKDGFPSRLGAEAVKYAEARNDKSFRSELDVDAVKRGALPKLGVQDGPVKFVLWGDSHAMAIASVIDTLCREKGYRGYAATHSSTAPLLNFISRGRYSLGGESAEFAKEVIKFAAVHRAELVILAAHWSLHASKPDFENALNRTVHALDAAGLKVVIVRDVPMQSGDVPWQLAKAVQLGRDVRSVGVPLELHRKENQNADRVFAKLTTSDAIVLDPAPYFVDEKGLCRAEYNDEALYFDDNHLSSAGASRLKPMFEKIFQ